MGAHKRPPSQVGVLSRIFLEEMMSQLKSKEEISVSAGQGTGEGRRGKMEFQCSAAKGKVCSQANGGWYSTQYLVVCVLSQLVSSVRTKLPSLFILSTSSWFQPGTQQGSLNEK
jgi:hypothetical protein